jgi:hypothetical protein
MGNFYASQESHYVSTTEPDRLMLSTGLCRRYINVTITILDIIHDPVFYLKHMRVIFILHRKHITSLLGAQQVKRSIGL